MRIAVCDDELIAREEISTVIEDYIHERKFDVDYELFDSYIMLEPVIEKFDIFIMDYQTPEIDGMTFAKMIRDNFGNGKFIIFVTSYREIVYDAFTVNAHRFLLKPIDKAKLFEALDSCLVEDKENKNLIIRNDGFTNIIKASDVFYIEVAGKESRIWFEDDMISVYRTISSLEDDLSDSDFFRVHRSYLVNMKKIKSFDSNRVELSNGKSIEISSRKYKAFCKKYLSMK